MAEAHYDPKVATVTVEYVTPYSEAAAFRSAYNQNLTDLSPFGSTVQAGGTAWPEPEEEEE
jgi:hypothetical protein